MDFLSAVYGENMELAMASFNEKCVLIAATTLINSQNKQIDQLLNELNKNRE
jgi:hypothetical protein